MEPQRWWVLIRSEAGDLRSAVVRAFTDFSTRARWRGCWSIDSDCCEAKSMRFLLTGLTCVVLFASVARHYRAGDISPAGIRLSRTVTLGDTAGPSVLGLPIAVLSVRNQFLVVTEADPSALLVFDSIGRYRARIGRNGQGPGEYRWILALAGGPADSITVFDAGTRRATVISSTFLPVRSYPLPGSLFPRGGAVMPGGAVVLNGIRRTVDDFGLAFQVLDADGNHLRSFAEYRGTLTPTAVYQALLRPFGVQSGSTIIAGYEWQHVFEEWDISTGKLTRTVRSPAPWFRGNSPDHPASPSRASPPPAKVRGLMVQERGAFRVISSVPDRRWRSQLLERNGPDGLTLAVDNYERYYDSRIEIIEAGTGMVVASAESDAMLVGFCDRDHAFSVRQDSTGFVRLDVWLIQVVK